MKGIHMANSADPMLASKPQSFAPVQGTKSQPLDDRKPYPVYGLSEAEAAYLLNDHKLSHKD